MIGSQLSHYRLTGKLGEGGMGVVYRAEDARLDREVALKVLPEGAVRSAEALARFEQEARVLASLSHPNVAVVHDVGEHEGTHFLVMELVEGPTLDERLEAGPLPLDRAIAVADQIADGLASAHEQGVVHRDLKPQNVKISADDRVKLLDFGLAKALGDEGTATTGRALTQSPTIGLDATAAGVILGTAAYMSPEQAKGIPVDKRADVWAFGVVLYEMLTGESLFRADTAPEILAQVLTATPTLERLPGDTPPALRRLLERCLQREPKSRLRDLGDARLELATALEELESSPLEVASDSSATVGSGPGPVVTALVAILIAAAAGLGGWLLAHSRQGSEPATEPRTYRVTLPHGQRFELVDSSILALSPDGRLLAFPARAAGEQQASLRVHSLVTGETRELEGTQGARHPAFSPDSRELAFFVDRALWRMPVEGGLRTRLADAPNPRGSDWSADGSIVFSPDFASGLLRVDVSTGRAEPLRLPDAARGERTYRWPDVDPTGRFVLYTVGFQQAASDYSQAEIAIAGLDGSGGATLIEAASMARFVASERLGEPNRLLFARGDRLFTVGLDLKSQRVIDVPLPVAGEIGGDPSSGVLYFTNSDRDIAYVPESASQGRYRLVIVDLESGAESAPALPEQSDLVTERLMNPVFSPDGRRVMFTSGSQTGDSWEISLDDESLQRLTFSDGRASGAVYEPSGDFVLYRQEGQGILRKSTDGRGTPEQIVPDTSGRLLNVWRSARSEGAPLVFDDVEAQEVLLGRAGEELELYEQQAVNPDISPDGRWIAFTSLESGSPTVVVRPVDGEGRWQVSPSLGSFPRFAAGGKLLFFYDLRSTPWDLVRVTVSSGGESFRFGRPELVVEGAGGRFESLLGFNYDISPSGDRGVFVEVVRDEAERDEIVVLHDRDLGAGPAGGS